MADGSCRRCTAVGYATARLRRKAPATTPRVSLCPRERHEANRNRAPLCHPVRRLRNERQPLLVRTDGNNQPPFARELIDETSWHLFGRRGHNNPVEWRVLRPAGISVAFTNVNV